MPKYAFQGALVAKSLPANAGDLGDMGLIPGSGRSPGGGHGNTPLFLPGETLGQRGVVGYSLMGLHRVGHNSSD